MLYIACNSTTVFISQGDIYCIVIDCSYLHIIVLYMYLNFDQVLKHYIIVVPAISVLQFYTSGRLFNAFIMCIYN